MSIWHHVFNWLIKHISVEYLPCVGSHTRCQEDSNEQIALSVLKEYMIEQGRAQFKNYSYTFDCNFKLLCEKKERAHV